MIQILIKCSKRECSKSKVLDGEKSPTNLTSMADYRVLQDDHSIKIGCWHYFKKYEKLLCPECSKKFEEHRGQVTLDAEEKRRDFFGADTVTV